MKISIGDRDFFFNCVHLFYYKCHKINCKRVASYKYSPDWIKNKKATTNPINKKDNNCFQKAITVVLNYEEIGKHLKEYQKLNLLQIYHGEEMNYSSEKDDWKISEKNSLTIALNALYTKKKQNHLCFKT